MSRSLTRRILDSRLRGNDKSLRDNGKLASPESQEFSPSQKGTLSSSDFFPISRAERLMVDRRSPRRL